MIRGCLFRPGHCTIQSTLHHVMTENIKQTISAPPEVSHLAMLRTAKGEVSVIAE